MIIRPAGINDGAALLRLKNEARFWSGVGEISEAAHAVWLENALLMPERHAIFVAQENPLTTVGYGRLEFVTEARVSFAVEEIERGKGIGQQILGELERASRGVPLVAYVHPGNYPSLRAFARCGYRLDEVRTEKGTTWQILRKDLR